MTVSGNGDSLTITGSADIVSMNNTGTLSLNIANATQDDALQFMNGKSTDQLWFSQEWKYPGGIRYRYAPGN